MQVKLFKYFFLCTLKKYENAWSWGQGNDAVSIGAALV